MSSTTDHELNTFIPSRAKRGEATLVCRAKCRESEIVREILPHLCWLKVKKKTMCRKLPGTAGKLSGTVGIWWELMGTDGTDRNCREPRELPETTGNCLEPTRPAGNCRELPRTAGTARNCREMPGNAWKCRELPRTGANCQELPGTVGNCREQLGYDGIWWELMGTDRNWQEKWIMLRKSILAIRASSTETAARTLP